MCIVGLLFVDTGLLLQCCFQPPTFNDTGNLVYVSIVQTEVASALPNPSPVPGIIAKNGTGFSIKMEVKYIIHSLGDIGEWGN